MVAVFSIHPYYAELIFLGLKSVEYRKTILKNTVEKIIIYETGPVSKVVGEAQVSHVLVGGLDEIWDITETRGCLQKEDYFQYYVNRNRAIAYFLKNPVKYKREMHLYEFGIKNPPQSFCYLRSEVATVGMQY